MATVMCAWDWRHGSPLTGSPRKWGGRCVLRQVGSVYATRQTDMSDKTYHVGVTYVGFSTLSLLAEFCPAGDSNSCPTVLE